MRASTATLVIVYAATLSLSACKVQAQAEDPQWGKTTCARCRMAVTDHAPAAQLVGPGARVRFYDDLGCLVSDMLAKPELEGGTPYVLSPGPDPEWVPADRARFTADARTPMDYGFMPARDGPLSFGEAVDAMKEAYGARWRLQGRPSGSGGGR